MKIQERIEKALYADPIHDLARELYREGWNSQLLNLELRKQAYVLIEDYRVIKLQNAMRDIEASGLMYKP